MSQAHQLKQFKVMISCFTTLTSLLQVSSMEIEQLFAAYSNLWMGKVKKLSSMLWFNMEQTLESNLQVMTQVYFQIQQLMWMILADSGLINIALNMDFSRHQVKFIQWDQNCLIINTGQKCVIAFLVGLTIKRSQELTPLGLIKVAGILKVPTSSLPTEVRTHGKWQPKRKTDMLLGKSRSLQLVTLVVIVEISIHQAIKLLKLWLLFRNILQIGLTAFSVLRNSHSSSNEKLKQN